MDFLLEVSFLRSHITFPFPWEHTDKHTRWVDISEMSECRASLYVYFFAQRQIVILKAKPLTRVVSNHKVLLPCVAAAVVQCVQVRVALKEMEVANGLASPCILWTLAQPNAIKLSRRALSCRLIAKFMQSRMCSKINISLVPFLCRACL